MENVNTDVQQNLTLKNKSILKEFWMLTDNEKANFYSTTTERNENDRKRTRSENYRKKYSFKYFLIKDEIKTRVCKQFYLGTLDISQGRIEHYHKKAVQNDFSDRRGLHTKRCISEETKSYIRDHINSFPRVPSHY